MAALCDDGPLRWRTGTRPAVSCGVRLRPVAVLRCPAASCGRPAASCGVLRLSDRPDTVIFPARHQQWATISLNLLTKVQKSCCVQQSTTTRTISFHIAQKYQIRVFKHQKTCLSKKQTNHNRKWIVKRSVATPGKTNKINIFGPNWKQWCALCSSNCSKLLSIPYV